MQNNKTYIAFLNAKNNNQKIMAIKITDECINCGACEPECPNNAIYEAGAEWAWADGNQLSGNITFNNESVDVTQRNAPVSDDVYFIVPSKCTECEGFHEEPQCAAVCPVDCCVPDPDHVESKEILLGKKELMHP
jgi:ferredoxin